MDRANSETASASSGDAWCDALYEVGIVSWNEAYDATREVVFAAVGEATENAIDNAIRSEVLACE